MISASLCNTWLNQSTEFSQHLTWINMHQWRLRLKGCNKSIVHETHHFHYENMPIQICWKFYYPKMKIFRLKNSYIFHIYAQNIDCGYSLEPPRRPPCIPQFYYIKVGFKGGQNYIRHVFVMWSIFCFFAQTFENYHLPRYGQFQQTTN